MEQTSVLLISAEDTDAARLLTRALLDRGCSVGVFSPVPFPAEMFPGIRLVDARELQAGELEPWFRARPYAVIIDLGAFRPESIELFRKLHSDDIDQYIFCSSTSVYAPGLDPPIDETAPLGTASTDLRDVERYLERVRIARNFPVTVVRSCPIYGEGRGSLSYFFDRILFGEGVLCPRPLEDSFQPLYVGDWIECLLGLIRNPKAIGEVFHLVGPEWITLGEFLEQVAAAAYTPLRVASYDAAEVPTEELGQLDAFPLPGLGHQLFSGLKLTEHCGLEAKVRIADGLDQGFLRYLQSAGEIGEPNLKAEARLSERLGLLKAPEPPKPAPESLPPEADPFEETPNSPAATPKRTAGQLGAPTKMGFGADKPTNPPSAAGQMGAPTRIGTSAGLGPIRRRRDPSELPPPPAETPDRPNIGDQRLDSMVDLMLSGVNREGEDELQVEMKDEVLGGLYIKIAQKDRKIRGTFGCRSRESRTSIEQEFPRLRRKLEQRGYQVAELVATILT